MQPTIVLEQGGAAAASGSSWACAIRTGSAAVHAVREADGQAALGESVLGPALAAMQVACIEGALQTALLCVHLQTEVGHYLLPACSVCEPPARHRGCRRLAARQRRPEHRHMLAPGGGCST